MQLGRAFDDRNRVPTLAQIDGQPKAYRPATNDDDVISLIEINHAALVPDSM